MLRKLRRQIAYLVALLAAAFVVAIALSDLAATARYDGFLALDSLLAKNEPVSHQAVAEYAKRLSQSPQTCRTDILNSAVDIAMANIENETASLDRSAWLAALRAMEPLLRDSLACMPTNGLLWVRLAVVRWLLGGTPEEQASLLAMSQAYSPSELRALRSRMVQWRRVSPRVLEDAENPLRADIRTVLTYARPAIARDILADLPPSIVPFIGDEARALSLDRRDALERAGIQLK